MEHSHPITSGSINEYLYRGTQSIDRVLLSFLRTSESISFVQLNQIDLQLIDEENTQWACESIEVQDLKSDEIVM